MCWEERIINYPWIEEYYTKENNFLVQCREQSCKKTYRYVQFAKYVNFKKHLCDTHSAVYRYEEKESNTTWKYFRLTNKNHRECILCETDDIKFSPGEILSNHVEKHLFRQQPIRMPEREVWYWKYLEQIGDFSAKCRLCADNTEIMLLSMKTDVLKYHIIAHGQTIQHTTWKSQTKKYYFLNKCYAKPVNLRSKCKVCKESFVCMEVPLLKQHFLQKHTFIYNEELKKESTMKDDNWTFFRFTRQVKETLECIICEKPVQNELRQMMYHRYTHFPQYPTIRLPSWEFKYLRQEENIVKCSICDENLNYYFQIENLIQHAATHADNMKRIDEEEELWKLQTEKNSWLQKCYINAGDFRAECKFCESKEVYFNNKIKRELEQHIVERHLDAFMVELMLYVDLEDELKYIRYISHEENRASNVECMICQNVVSLPHPHPLNPQQLNFYSQHWPLKYMRQEGCSAKCTICKENVNIECDMDNLKNHMLSVHPEKWETIQKNLEQATAHDQAGPSTSYAN